MKKENFVTAVTEPVPSQTCRESNNQKIKNKTKLKFLLMLIITLVQSVVVMVSLSNQAFSQGVGINTDGSNPAGSAILDVKSIAPPYQGLLIPRLTTAQRDAISSPVESLMIFNTTTKCFEAYVNGAWNTVSCPAACTPPTAPVSNAASGIACTSFTANWAASAGATAYLLDVATDAGFTSFVAGYNNLNVGNVTSSPVSGLTAGTAYYYRVRATTACVSGNSGTQNPTTLAAPTSAPTAGTHTPSQTQIVWNWNTVAGATGYKWNTANDYATATDNGASTTKTQTGLTCNTAYTLYVWAYNACGNFATPVTLTQTTSACCPCIVAGFPLRRPISITNTSGSALTDYQVLITVTYDADMKSDFADLRFRDGSCTDLPYWVETYTASTSATVWVKVPSIPTSGTTIYMYYGNAGAATASNGTNTFDFFDDFNDLNLDGWTDGGGGGTLTMTGTKIRLTAAEMRAVHNVSNTNSVIEMVMNYGGDNNNGDGLIFRRVGSAEYQYLYRADGGNLLAKDASVSTITWGTGTTAGLTNVKIKVITNGNSIKGYVNNNLFLDTTDPSYSTGTEVGIIHRTSGFNEYDDFRVRKYASPEPNHNVEAEESCN